MTDQVWRRQEIESPCIKICLLHPQAKICTGCFRTGQEIATWSRMTAEERRALMAELPNRKPLIAQRRGGRRARLASSD